MNQQKKGLLFGISCFCLWGLSPLLWKQLAFLSPEEIIFHRSIWPAIALLFIILAKGEGKAFLQNFARARTFVGLVISATFIFINWLIYMKGVEAHHIAELSFGYFINPFFNIMISALLFHEKIAFHKKVALALIVVSIALQFTDIRHIPLYALGVSTTFAGYAATRKAFPVDGLHALTVESILVLATSFFWLHSDKSFVHTVIAAGPFPGAVPLLTAISIVPFVFYLYGLKYLELSTMSYLQYFSPSLKLLMALLVFGEEMSAKTLVSFALVWVGIIWVLQVEWRKKRHLKASVDQRLQSV